MTTNAEEAYINDLEYTLSRMDNKLIDMYAKADGDANLIAQLTNEKEELLSVIHELESENLGLRGQVYLMDLALTAADEPGQFGY